MRNYATGGYGKSRNMLLLPLRERSVRFQLNRLILKGLWWAL